MISLRFVRGKGWDSKLIEWQTRSWCSHVELITEDRTMTFGAQLKGGIRWRSANDKCYRNVSRWEVWSLPSTPEQDRVLQEWITETDGWAYDWREIISFGLGEKDWRTDDRLICSTWAMTAIEKIRATALPKEIPVDRISPRDVFMLWVPLVVNSRPKNMLLDKHNAALGLYPAPVPDQSYKKAA